MRSLLREKRTVYVSQPLPKQQVLDENGNRIGVYMDVYDEPVELQLNVKPITDQLERQSFGTDVNRVVKAVCTPFDVGGYQFVEGSAVWIGISPNGVLYNGNDDNPMNCNYTIEQVLNTGCQVSVYFKKVAGESK